MKTLRAITAVVPRDGVTVVVRNVDRPDRRRELERLLLALLDKQAAPDEADRP